MSEIVDNFRGDTEHLRESIRALIALDDAKVLVPHGMGRGSHAYRLLSAAYHRLAAQAHEPSADVVERVARIVDPASWAQYDISIRPYAENRGSLNEEYHWYNRTWAQGCRSVEDVNDWWRVKADTQVEATYVLLFRLSLEKATAAIAAMRQESERAGIVDWLRAKNVADNNYAEYFARQIERGDHIKEPRHD